MTISSEHALARTQSSGPFKKNQQASTLRIEDIVFLIPRDEFYNHRHPWLLSPITLLHLATRRTAVQGKRITTLKFALTSLYRVCSSQRLRAYPTAGAFERSGVATGEGGRSQPNLAGVDLTGQFRRARQEGTDYFYRSSHNSVLRNSCSHALRRNYVSPCPGCLQRHTSRSEVLSSCHSLQRSCDLVTLPTYTQTDVLLLHNINLTERVCLSLTQHTTSSTGDSCRRTLFESERPLTCGRVFFAGGWLPD